MKGASETSSPWKCNTASMKCSSLLVNLQEETRRSSAKA
ncbi:hypothetical protein A2U01_0092872, partial [Trifolium medium]|nr:hypothetical protein [Trifolium medium]